MPSLVYAGELQNTADELKESNCKLDDLKAQRDAAKGVGFPVLNLGSKHVSIGKISDKVKDLHDMESSLKELKVLHCTRIHMKYIVLCLSLSLKKVSIQRGSSFN